MFKKTCFNCGAKVDVLHNGLCDNCFRKIHPPIETIKPINLKVCNSCKKIFFQNRFVEEKELVCNINNIVKKHIVLNNNYVLKDLNVLNFKIEGENVSFDVDVDCDFVDR